MSRLRSTPRFGRFRQRTRAIHFAVQTARRSFDPFSPPIFLGGVFLVLFGVGIVDSFLSDDIESLRGQLVSYRGLSYEAVLYLVAGYVCFVVGYAIRPATTFVRRIRPAPRQWVPSRVTVLTTGSFILTFT